MNSLYGLHTKRCRKYWQKSDILKSREHKFSWNIMVYYVIFVCSVMFSLHTCSCILIIPARKIYIVLILCFYNKRNDRHKCMYLHTILTGLLTHKKICQVSREKYMCKLYASKMYHLQVKPVLCTPCVVHYVYIPGWDVQYLSTGWHSVNLSIGSNGLFR